jgi:hypothetical protein
MATSTTTAATTTKKRQQAMPAPQRPYHPSAGDLIFVRPAADDRIGQIVARETDGPFCHVRIRLSADMQIEALARAGVVRSFVQIEPDPADVANIGPTLEADRLAHMLAWLIQQEGQPYGGLAIVADVVKALLPPRLGSRTPFLVAPSRYDCSALACQAVVLAGYKWLPDALATDVTRCSPNDLARALGVLK